MHRKHRSKGERYEIRRWKKYVDGTGRVVTVYLERPGTVFLFSEKDKRFSYMEDGKFLSGTRILGSATDFNFISSFVEE